MVQAGPVGQPQHLLQPVPGHMVAAGLQQEVQHVSVFLVAMVTEADEAVDVVACSQVLYVLEDTACGEKGRRRVPPAAEGAGLPVRP